MDAGLHVCDFLSVSWGCPKLGVDLGLAVSVGSCRISESDERPVFL